MLPSETLGIYRDAVPEFVGTDSQLFGKSVASITLLLRSSASRPSLRPTDLAYLEPMYAQADAWTSGSPYPDRSGRRTAGPIPPSGEYWHPTPDGIDGGLSLAGGRASSPIASRFVECDMPGRKSLPICLRNGGS